MTRCCLLFLLAWTAAARAEPPRDWLFRASPGLGYALDGASTCTMQGRMFIGGFALEHDVADGLLVGAATTIMFNTLLPDAPCGSDGLRLAMGTVVGPSIEWYPFERRGLQLFALGGYAEIDHAMGEMMDLGRGVGGTVGVGWDWRGDGKRHRLLYGVRLQVMMERTWTGPVDHSTYAPSIVATFGAD